MRLYITGLPNSGTTYVARLFMESGWDFGTQVWPNSGRRKGMEYVPLWVWVRIMWESELGTFDPTPELFTYERRNEYVSAYPPPQTPECVKVPDFNFHRLHEYYQPETILKVVRPKDQWLRSMVKYKRGTPELLDEVYDWALPRLPGEVVEYPRIADDASYAETFGIPHSVWEEVTNPGWVGR